MSASQGAARHSSASDSDNLRAREYPIRNLLQTRPRSAQPRLADAHTTLPNQTGYQDVETTGQNTGSGAWRGSPGAVRRQAVSVAQLWWPVNGSAVNGTSFDR